MLKITRFPISQKPVNQKKSLSKLHISKLFLQIFDSKFKIPIATEIWHIFQHLANQHLTAKQMAQRWHTQNPK